MSEASNSIPAASISPPEGPWQQIPGGVTAAKGEPKERNLILQLLHATASDEKGDEPGTGQAWGGAIISKLPPFLSFTGSPSSEMAGGVIISKCNPPPNQQISATTSACSVNILRWEKERNQAYELDIMLLACLGWKIFPRFFKNIINTMLSNRPESLPSSSSFLL